MTCDRDANTGNLLKLISQDAAIAGRIMRAVNSAFYALPNKITRLDQAVALMGMKAVKEVALSATMAGMCKSVSFGTYQDRDLWDHSVGVAILARELAVHTQSMDAEEAFLAGILHDIGLLMALQSDPKKGTQLLTLAENGPAFFPLEATVFGFNHTELGARLAVQWKFPENIEGAIRWHHQPNQAPEEHQMLCRHLYLADTLACLAKVGCPLTCNQQTVTDDQLAAAGLTRETADATVAKLPILLRLFMS